MKTKSVIVFVGGKCFSFEAAVELMDDDIREYLHSNHCDELSEQEFIDVYCSAHREKFGKNFTIN